VAIPSTDKATDPDLPEKVDDAQSEPSEDIQKKLEEVKGKIKDNEKEL